MWIGYENKNKKRDIYTLCDCVNDFFRLKILKMRKYDNVEFVDCISSLSQDIFLKQLSIARIINVTRNERDVSWICQNEI